MTPRKSSGSFLFTLALPAVFVIGLSGAYFFLERRPGGGSTLAAAAASAAVQPAPGGFWVPERVSALTSIMLGADQERAERAAVTRRIVRKFLVKSLASCRPQISSPAKLAVEGDLNVGKSTITLSNLRWLAVAQGGPVAAAGAACITRALAGEKILPLNPLAKYLQGYAGSEIVHVEFNNQCQ